MGSKENFSRKKRTELFHEKQPKNFKCKMGQTVKSEQIPLEWYVLALRPFINAKLQRLQTTLGEIKGKDILP